MLSYGALESSNNPYIETTVKPCISMNQRGIFAAWVREKNNSFKIHIIILRYKRNVNLPFKKDFKFAELLNKISFFL